MRNETISIQEDDDKIYMTNFFFFFSRFPSSLGALFFFHHQFWIDHEIPPPIWMNQVYVLL
jgi:hypothetical protein